MFLFPLPFIILNRTAMVLISQFSTKLQYCKNNHYFCGPISPRHLIYKSSTQLQHVQLQYAGMYSYNAPVNVNPLSPPHIGWPKEIWHSQLQVVEMTYPSTCHRHCYCRRRRHPSRKQHWRLSSYISSSSSIIIIIPATSSTLALLSSLT